MNAHLTKGLEVAVSNQPKSTINHDNLKTPEFHFITIFIFIDAKRKMYRQLRILSTYLRQIMIQKLLYSFT